MKEATNETIVIRCVVDRELAEVWKLWTLPEHIVHWNFANTEWHCPAATNELRTDGKFSYRMEAKDGSFGFDFSGIYTRIEHNKQIIYMMDDGRLATIDFIRQGEKTEVVERFEAEKTNSMELQRDGWQAILNNFKHYAEGANIDAD